MVQRPVPEFMRPLIEKESGTWNGRVGGTYEADGIGGHGGRDRAGGKCQIIVHGSSAVGQGRCVGRSNTGV